MDGAIWLLAAVAGALGYWAGVRIGRRPVRRAARAAQAAASERARAAEALAARDAAMDAILRAALDAVIVLDDALSITAASASAERLVAVSPAAGAPLLAAIRSAELRDLLDASRRDGQDLGAMTLRHGGRLLEISAAAVRGGGWALAARDRTDHERLERARRDLVANVSHDLRTPLASITLLLEGLAADEAALAEHARPLVGQLLAQVATLTHLADGLVELERIESGRAPFRLEAVALRPMADEALAAVEPLLGDRSVSLEVSIDPALRVLADRRHVVRLIVNLVDNARHASPEGGTIAIGAAAEGDDVRLWVSDEGPGIAPSERERVFERFYRGDRARSGTGSGLGLAIAKHVAEGHGGAIWIAEPDGARRGATVCVRLLGAPAA